MMIYKARQGAFLQQNTLPETNSSHLKMDGWKMNFLLGWPIFRCELLVSGRVNQLFLALVFRCVEGSKVWC